MNIRIGLGLLLVAAGLLAVILGISRDSGQTFPLTAGLLAEAAGLFLISSGSPKKKQ